MKIAEILPQYPDRLWSYARQAGATHAVARMPEKPNGQVSLDYLDLLHMKNRMADAGLILDVIEPGLNWQLHNMKLGVAGRDQDIEDCKSLIRHMGALGISVLCYNFMAQFNWLRTSVSTVTRGGAMVTSYNHADMKNAPLTEAGEVSEARLWENLQYFLEEVVPVAEECKVKLALHPDDPPVSPIQGISRIIINPAALKKAIKLVPSEYHGVTFCQGSLAAAGADIPKEIREIGNKIFYVHFRDIRGTAEHFSETFHDDGQTNMFAAIRAYKDVGYNGPIRIDHVPTMDGENNREPGYGEVGRLFALGYLKGLLEAVDNMDKLV